MYLDVFIKRQTIWACLCISAWTYWVY